MRDHERLLVGLFSEDHHGSPGGVGPLEVVEMLYELGAEHRAQVHYDRMLVDA